MNLRERLLGAVALYGLRSPEGDPSPPPVPNVPPVPPAQRDPDRHPTGYSPEYVKDLREETKGWRLKATEQEQARKAAETAAEAATKAADEKIKAIQEAAASER